MFRLISINVHSLASTLLPAFGNIQQGVLPDFPRLCPLQNNQKIPIRNVYVPRQRNVDPILSLYYTRQVKRCGLVEASAF